MRTLTVDLGSRSYPIWIGRGLLQSPGLLDGHVGRRVAIVTNEVVAPLYLPAVHALLGSRTAVTVVLPDGESHKTLTDLEQVFTALLEHRCDRGTTLLALGGGVVGDMAGFAAACYQRGIPFIQVPTTLLAQVDSSVGGKTGVNHPLGKNMIGAFYQPEAVVIDTDTLKTLPDRELSAGLAEIIKYGLIRDPDFFVWLERHMDGLLARDDALLAEAIERSCRHKAQVVAADERERGQRALLNLGHTFGHAIETGMGYGAWLHGEAVAAGMMLAALLSERLGWLPESDTQRLRRLLEQAHLPVAPPRLETDAWLRLMAVDKKVQDGRMRLVLLRALGEACLVEDCPRDVLLQVLTAAAA